MFETASTPDQVESLVRMQLAISPPLTSYHLLVMLHRVTHFGNDAVTKLLLHHGVEIHNGAIYNAVCRNSGSIPILEAFVDAGWDVNKPMKYQGDALVLAVNHNNAHIVRWLLLHGAKPTLTGYYVLFIHKMYCSDSL
jgi:ankyrin repeat protein